MSWPSELWEVWDIKKSEGKKKSMFKAQTKGEREDKQWIISYLSFLSGKLSTFPNWKQSSTFISLAPVKSRRHPYVEGSLWKWEFVLSQTL